MVFTRSSGCTDSLTHGRTDPNTECPRRRFSTVVEAQKYEQRDSSATEGRRSGGTEQNWIIDTVVGSWGRQVKVVISIIKTLCAYYDGTRTITTV